MKPSIAKLDKDITALHAKVDNLTTLVGVYKTQADRLEGRVWGAMGSALMAFLASVLGYIFKK